MFKAGISDPVNTVLAWYVARDAGFYAANGLNVDILNMSGGSRGAAELQAGRLDTMHVGLSSVIKVIAPAATCARSPRSATSSGSRSSPRPA